MLYKRSAFLNLLQTKYTCELKPLRDGRTILIKNGPATAYMFIDDLDRIDYEEIYIYYRKLCLHDLPTEKDLVPIDESILPASKKKKKR